MVEHDAFEEATRRAKRRRAEGPTAVGARYDRRIGRVVVSLSTGLDIAFSPRDAQGLETARPADLDPIEISPSGLGLHFPKLDADLYLPALLEGVLGSEHWVAADLGQRGGRVRTEAKASAARQNGALGGRPRKRSAPGEAAEPERAAIEMFCEGVRKQRLVRFLYRGKERLVAPHAVFRSTKSKLSVSGIEVADPLDPWSRYEIKTYHVPDASGLTLTDYPFEPDTEFSSAQAKYRKGVICAMDLEPEAATSGLRGRDKAVRPPPRSPARVRRKPM